MKILAFETSSHVASVAVLADDMLLGEFTINHPKTHSQKLMPMLEMLLEALELNIKDFRLSSGQQRPGLIHGCAHWRFDGQRLGTTA